MIEVTNDSDSTNENEFRNWTEILQEAELELALDKEITI